MVTEISKSTTSVSYYWFICNKITFEVYGRMGVKIYAIELNHLTKMTVMPIYDKNLKQTLLLQNQLTDDLEN